MPLPARRYEREDEVDAALRALGNGGLDRAVLSGALLFGEAERRGCTENDPGILTGMIGWGRPIRYLREQMHPRGWRREEPNSLPLVVAPDRSVGVTVAAGDEQTGNSRAQFAATKWVKGPMLREWVNPSRQISLLDPDGDEGKRYDLPEELWLLLVRRTPLEIVYELSRPTSVTPGGRLRCGGTRILLNPLPIDQTLPVDDADDDEDEGLSPDVPVERI
jgi:hypothetical protein